MNAAIINSDQPKNSKVKPIRPDVESASVEESEALVAARAYIDAAQSALDLDKPEVIEAVAALTETELHMWLNGVKAKKQVKAGFAQAKYKQKVAAARREATVGRFEPNAGGKPDVIISDLKQPTETVDEILEALRLYSDAKGGILYRREGQIVTVRKLDEGDGYSIIPATESSIVDHILAAANIYQQNVNNKTLDKSFKAVTPPAAIVKAVLHRENEALQPLAGITTGPIINADGSLSQTVGYNAKNRFIYRPIGEAMPEVNDAPTQAEARASMAYLMEHILGGFQFTDDGEVLSAGASRANAAALLLTPALRRCYTGLVPMAIIEAPVAGSGKSLLAKVIGTIYLGREPGMYGSSEKKEIGDEEIRKVLLGVVRERSEFLILDNVKGTFSSSALERFLSSEILEDRAMSTNKMESGPNLTTPMMTSNNARIGGDLWRRAYRIRIDTKMAKPSERGPEHFKHPHLIGWLTGKGVGTDAGGAHRPEVLHHIHTVIRAWFAAGRPAAQKMRHMANFEVWATTVASILEFAGVEGFLQNQSSLTKEMSPEMQAWEDFMLDWWREFGMNALPINYMRACFPKDVLTIHNEVDGAELLFDHDEVLGTQGLPAELERVAKKPRMVLDLMRKRCNTPVGDAEYVFIEGADNKGRAEFHIEPRKPWLVADPRQRHLYEAFIRWEYAKKHGGAEIPDSDQKRAVKGWCQRNNVVYIDKYYD